MVFLIERAAGILSLTFSVHVCAGACTRATETRRANVFKSRDRAEHPKLGGAGDIPRDATVR